MSVDFEPGMLRPVLLGFSVMAGAHVVDVLSFLDGAVRAGSACSSAQRLRFCVATDMTEGCGWGSSFIVWVGV